MWVVLENVRSLYNVGSVMRTMSFFGMNQLILIGYSGRKKPDLDELHEKIMKTSLGAEKDIEIKWLKTNDELIKFCKKNKYKLVAIEQDKKSVRLNDWQVDKKSVIVLGNELQGVSLKVLKNADQIVEIPRLGKKGSLNVATTAGIVIEKYSRLRTSNI